MKTFGLFILFFLLSLSASAQEKQSVVIGSLTDRPNALLIVNPPNNDQGVLLPQLTTTQRMALKPNSPTENGLMVYDKEENAYYYWSEGSWARIGTGKHRTYLSVDPLHFQELKRGADLSNSNLVVFEDDNSFLTVRSNALSEVAIAPLDLPHGAFLEGVTFYYMDNHPDGNIRFSLLRKSLTGTSEEIVSMQSYGASPEVVSRTINGLGGKRTIDLENYTYRVMIAFELPENEIVENSSAALQRVYGIRLQYRQ